MLERTDDTIVAISSAPGSGAVGILRLSGPQSTRLARQIASFPPAVARGAPGRFRAELDAGGGLRFPGVVGIFYAPRSYTREDLVEIHTLGAPVVLEILRGRLMALGAVEAQPGEFTARAFLNGAMDLARAEGVAGLIRAGSDTELQAARRMMDGALSRAIFLVRDALAEILGLVEAVIDFVEEPIEFISPADLRHRLDQADRSLEGLLGTQPSKERLDSLPRILLLGRPNAGKSSLLNRLSGRVRAICAEVAGTTRDILAAPVQLGSRHAVLLDGAGIDETEDAVLQAARHRTTVEAAVADLICIVLDGPEVVREAAVEGRASAKPGNQLRLLALSSRSSARGVITVVNKCDLLTPDELERSVRWVMQAGPGPLCVVSALRGDGMDDLRSALTTALDEVPSSVMAQAVKITERQRAAIAAADASLKQALAIAEKNPAIQDCADVLAFELREALDALAQVTGAVTTEELLAQVFAHFCIGK